MRALPVLIAVSACGGSDAMTTRGVAIDTGARGCVTAADGLEVGFAATLARTGCHYMVRAVDPDGTIVLTLDVPAFAEALGGATVDTVYTLPDEAVRLEVRAGCGFTGAACGPDPASSFATSTWTPVAGSIAVQAAPDGPDVRATVALTDVLLVDEWGDDAAMDPVTWTDVLLYGSDAR